MILVLPVPVSPVTKILKPGLFTPRPNSIARIARSWPIKSSSGVISAVQVNGRKDKSQRQASFSAGTSKRVDMMNSLES